MKHKRWLARLAVSALLLEPAAATTMVVARTPRPRPRGRPRPSPRPRAAKPLTELGEGEGEVNASSPGRATSRTAPPIRVDWVTGFEEETGCNVNVKVGNTSDEMVALMQSGGDGVSASVTPPCA